MTKHTVYQKCQRCNTPGSNIVKMVFGEGVPNETFKRQIDKKIIMWSSKCSKCGVTDGKHFPENRK